jgi:hypothetical protein
MTEPLYRRLLRHRYGALPDAVQRLHDVSQPRRWRGEGTVTRGATFPARVLGTLLSLPAATTPGERCEVVVTFTPDGAGGETWSRMFAAREAAGRPFVSYQWGDGNRLFERVGFTRFVFRLEADATGLRLVLVKFCVFGLSMPAALRPHVRTREHQVCNCYHFDVEALLPLGLGLLVHYEGWLKPDDGVA